MFTIDMTIYYSITVVVLFDEYSIIPAENTYSICFALKISVCLYTNNYYFGFLKWFVSNRNSSKYYSISKRAHLAVHLKTGKFSKL